jgi:hypothetical protein
MPRKALGPKTMRRFEYELASDLHMTRGQLLAALDNAEFAEWIAVYRQRDKERQRAQRRQQARATRR